MRRLDRAGARIRRKVRGQVSSKRVLRLLLPLTPSAIFIHCAASRSPLWCWGRGAEVDADCDAAFPRPGEGAVLADGLTASEGDQRKVGPCGSGL